MKINMKIKEFNDKTWETIQSIKKEISLTGNLVIEWKKQLNSKENFHTDRNEFLSVLELEKLEAVKIRVESIRLTTQEAYSFGFPPKDNGKILYLEILQPKFDEIYNEYERLSKNIRDEVNKKIFLEENKDLILGVMKEKVRDSNINKIPKIQSEIELIKNLVIKENKLEKPHFHHKLKSGIKWENITIKFLNKEEVFIQATKQFNDTTDYKKMGFIGRGNNPRPSEAWTFLLVLAKQNGELTIKDPEAKDKYKKQKEILTKNLQDYFSLEYDPFYPYHSSSEKSGNSYKIKILLIPPPEY